MRIFAIDPGPSLSSFVAIEEDEIVDAGEKLNKDLRHHILNANETVGDVCFVCEDIECFGMAVGKETFETCKQIGRLQQLIEPKPLHLMPRRVVKHHLCNSAKAKDKNIRQALIDKLGHPGTKKNPGKTFGISKHLWSALAIATTFKEAHR